MSCVSNGFLSLCLYSCRYQNLLYSCLRILRCLQFESSTLRGPLMSDASQLLPPIWHYAYIVQFTDHLRVYGVTCLWCIVLSLTGSGSSCSSIGTSIIALVALESFHNLHRKYGKNRVNSYMYT